MKYFVSSGVHGWFSFFQLDQSFQLPLPAFSTPFTAVVVAWSRHFLLPFVISFPKLLSTADLFALLVCVRQYFCTTLWLHL